MSLIDTLKTAYDIAQKLQSVELQQMLTDMRKEALDREEEVLVFRKRIQQLEEAADIRANLSYDRGAYWLNKEGPYCQRCWDVDNKLVRLQDHSSTDAGPYWVCFQCERGLTL